MKNRFVGLTLCLAAATGVAQAGAIIHVANNGLDEPGCGTAANPCRSISAGIGAAAEGDTVIVRPGLYGDLDMDDVLGSQGEEAGDNYAIVNVNKRVTVISSAGPQLTTIRGITGRGVVHISADGAQFGAKGAGFTLQNTVSIGLATDPLPTGKIAGNVTRGGMPLGIAVTSAGVWDVSDNYILDNAGQGISAQSANDGTGVVNIHDNIIYGIEFAAGIQLGPRAAHRVYNNDINGPYYGIVVTPGLARVYGNTLINNRIGIAYSDYYNVGTSGNTPVISRNTIVGNRGSGIVVLNTAAYPLTVRENNIYGNGVCGIATNGSIAVDARNNYWGSPTGPSFTNPADPVCDTATPTVKTTPFATREFQIR